MRGNPTAKTNKKQNVMAKQSAKVELKSLVNDVNKLIWLKLLLLELQVLIIIPMIVYCDNKIALSMVYNLIHHDQIKYEEID